MIRDGNTNTPGKNTWKLHVEKAKEKELEQALETIAENPNSTTVVVNNGNNHKNIKTEPTENENTNNKLGDPSE